MAVEPLHRTRGLFVVGVVLTSVLAVGGCALGEQGHPVPVKASPTAQVPGNDNVRSNVWSTSTISVFLVHEDRLIRVGREVVVQPGETPVAAALVAPVTEEETREGLRTALPTPLRTLDVTVRDRTAHVRLPHGFDDLDVSEQILGAGQIVYTLTGDGTVDAVQFTESSQQVAVPNGAGRLVSGPVDRSDYAVVAPVASGS